VPDAIPDGITRDDVIKAIGDFDAGVTHPFAESTGYDLIWNGKPYPPKAIVGLAARREAGRLLTPYDFKGGEGSRCFRILRDLGFEVRPKPGHVEGVFTVITENDESQWHDQTGALYHYPKRYRNLLRPGTKVVYYKGRQRDSEYAARRLSEAPHYFGTAVIGKSWTDPNSAKEDLFAQVIDYRPFATAVLAKVGDQFYETIPDSRVSNYWRDGVRGIDKAVYDAILSAAVLAPELPDTGLEKNDDNQGSTDALESGVEGQQRQRYVTYYERDPNLRKAAIALHRDRLICAVCDFDFAAFYGELGEGYIHIHHRSPVAELGGPTEVNPATDLVPVCANCHAIIHRRRSVTLGVEELRAIVEGRRAGNSRRYATV
jgi:predicted HNH restriction endonuclease